MKNFREWLGTAARTDARYSPAIIDTILANFSGTNGADDRAVLDRAIADAPERETEFRAVFNDWKRTEDAPPTAGSDTAGPAPNGGPQQAPGAGWPEKGRRDALGLTVRRIYIGTKYFAIYSADDEENQHDVCGLRYYLNGSYEACKELRGKLIALAPQIAYITDAVCSMQPILRSSGSPWSRDHHAFRERIFELVAQAMSAALEDRAEEAQSILDQTRACVDERRDSKNRMRYVIANTVSAALILLGGAWLFVSGAAEGLLPTMAFADDSLPVVVVLMAGALGAFFSVAVALHEVKVRWSITLSEMFYAGSVRIPVGVIAAAAVTWLVDGGWILGSVHPQYMAASVLLFGFLAGFSERFVPNALKQVEGQTQAKTPGAAPRR